MENIVVIGAGVMGSALAIHLGNNGHRVNLWGTQWDREAIDQMKKTKEHESLGVAIPEKVCFYYDDQIEEAFKDTKLIIIAVISDGIKSMSEKIAAYVEKDHVILSITKGIDGDSLLTMSTIIENSLPEEIRESLGLVKLGGPIIAAELAEGRYTEGIFASKNIEAARFARDIFRTSKFKARLTKDILGVDLCAAFKNSYAIGMGIIEGLEGDSNNPKAALMARGTIEMSNIVRAYGGSRETALGIAGVGDYYVTAQGGRNGMFGAFLGQGDTVDEALENMQGQTVEGLAVTHNGYKLLEKLEKKGKLNIKKDTPLFLEIYNVLYNNKSAKDAIQSYWLSD